MATGDMSSTPGDMAMSTTPVGPGNYPAAHATFPTVTKGPGSVLTAPVIVPVFYQNDPYIAQTMSFVQSLAASSYWSTVTSAYGVGAITVRAPVTVTTTPPATLTETQLDSWLAGQIGSNADFGAHSASTIFAFFPPSDTTVTLNGTDLCAQALGYHTATSVGGTYVPYTVVGRCPNGLNTTNTPRNFDVITSVFSHEAVEAATDPAPSPSTNAYYAVDTRTPPSSTSAAVRSAICARGDRSRSTPTAAWATPSSSASGRTQRR